MDKLMDKLIVELTDYVVEIYVSDNNDQTKNELVNTKMLDILRRLGYSDSLSQIIITNAQQPGSLITIYNNFYRLFESHQNVRGSIENRIETILDNFTLLKLSIRNEPEKTLEEKIRRYFRNNELNDTNLYRMIPIISDIILKNPDTFTKLSIHDVIEFEEYNKIGDLFQIHTIFYKLLEIMDYAVNPIINQEQLVHTFKEYFVAKECSDNMYEDILFIFDKYRINARRIQGRLKDMWTYISSEIEEVIQDYKIAIFLDTVEDNLENIPDKYKLFRDKYKISSHRFHQIFNKIIKLKIEEQLKKSYILTESSIKEFLSNNKAISRTKFNQVISSMGIDIYLDPILNPETGESLDQEGNVLPNCPICWNILNINIPIKPYEMYSIKRLACGGLFHLKCLANKDFLNEQNIIVCPICGHENL